MLCESPAKQNQSFSFPIVSAGAPMTYVATSDSAVNFETLFVAVCAVGLLVALAGTWYSSTLGVETLTLLQLVFLLHFQTDHYTQSW